MAQDVKINCESGKFKFRVVGILRYKDMFLVQKIQNNTFYCLAGGHVELGEDTHSAIEREMKEELPYAFKVNKLVTVIQNFFKDENGKVFHEIGYYYLLDCMEDITELSKVVVENDKGEMKRLEYKWLTLEEIENEDFRPFILKDLLKDIDNAQGHIILKEEK